MVFVYSLINLVSLVWPASSFVIFLQYSFLSIAFVVLLFICSRNFFSKHWISCVLKSNYAFMNGKKFINGNFHVRENLIWSR